MGVIIQEQDDSILLYQFEDPWSLEDLMDSQVLLNEIMDRTTNPFTIIVDYTHGGTPPRRLISNFGTLVNNQIGMERIDRIICVGTHQGTVRAAAAIFSNVFHKLDITDSVDKAFDMVRDTT